MSSVLEHPPLHKTGVLPLRNGDVLDQPTFHERHRATSDTLRAELIGGVVHLPSPVTNGHAVYQYDITGWLFHYQSRTPGVQGGDNGTVILDDENEPQPDAILRIDESCGGASRVNEAGYIEGSPELHVEVAYSSVSIDLHGRRDSYEQAGVREYLVVLIEEQELRAFRLEDEAYARSPLDKEGVWRSAQFPGLWLDSRALFARNAAQLLATLDKGLASDEHQAFVKRLADARD